MKRSPFIHVGIAAAIVLASLAIYTAWYENVKNVSARAVSLQSEINSKESETGRAVAARDALGSFTTDGSATNAHFVAEKDVVPFLQEVQKFGTSVGAKTTVASVAADDNTLDPSIRLSLSISGTFDAVMRTLGIIEHSPYAMRTEMFDMKADESSASQWTARAVLLVSTPLAATSTPETL